MDSKSTGINSCLLPLLRRCGLIKYDRYYVHIGVVRSADREFPQQHCVVTDGGYCANDLPFHRQREISSMGLRAQLWYRRAFPPDSARPTHCVMSCPEGLSHAWLSGACFVSTRPVRYLECRVGFALFLPGPEGRTVAEAALARLERIHALGESMLQKRGSVSKKEGKR